MPNYFIPADLLPKGARWPDAEKGGQIKIRTQRRNKKSRRSGTVIFTNTFSIVKKYIS